MLVNLGDLIQFCTAGRYTTTVILQNRMAFFFKFVIEPLCFKVHLLLVLEEEIRRKSTRQFIAFFVHLDVIC